MACLTEFTDQVSTAIYKEYERRAESEKARTYLGASVIGKECARALWYAFRWANYEKFEGRMLRLFQTGHLAEPRFTDDLRSIGADVQEVDAATGKQFGYVGHGGHARGHADGIATGIPGGGKKQHIVEYKTHSSKSFEKLKRLGVKKAKPEHYAQMTWYMGKAGLDRALYLAVNKDNEELHSERIEFDPVEFARIEARFDAIIFAGEPPSKISEDPHYYLCGWCVHKGVCHTDQVPQKTCRSCCHSTPEREGDGRWSCAKHGPEIPVEFQRKGCGNHLPLPFLLTYARPVDAGEGWVEFQRKDDASKHFIVKDEATALPGDMHLNKFIYTSAEISAAKDHRAICDEVIADMRNAYPGSKLVG